MLSPTPHFKVGSICFPKGGKKKYNWYAKTGEKNQIINCSIKNTKGRKKVEDKNSDKKQGQQIKNNNRYGNY